MVVVPNSRACAHAKHMGSSDSDDDLEGLVVDTSEDECVQGPKPRGRPKAASGKAKAASGKAKAKATAASGKPRAKCKTRGQIDAEAELEEATVMEEEPGKANTARRAQAKATKKTKAKGQDRAMALLASIADGLGEQIHQNVTSKSRRIPSAPEAIEDDDAVPSDQTTSDDDDDEGQAQSRPSGSNVGAYARWAVDQVSPEDCARICAKPRGMLSFCTGMATDVIVTDALARALRAKNHELQVRHLAACELKAPKLAFIRRRFNVFEHYFKDVKDMANPTIMDEATQEVVDRPKNSDVLTVGFSCKDISGMTTKPKSERGENGSSAVTLRGTLAYLDALALEERPKLLVIENVRAQP